MGPSWSVTITLKSPSTPNQYREGTPSEIVATFALKHLQNLRLVQQLLAVLRQRLLEVAKTSFIATSCWVFTFTPWKISLKAPLPIFCTIL